MRCQSLIQWMTVCLVVTASAVTMHAQAQPAGKTATAVYMDYLAALPKAKSMDDLKMYISANMRKQVDATPAADRAKMFGMMQMMSGMNTDIKVTKEERTAKGATLTATAKGMDGKPVKGTITMVREAGAWKLDMENWSS
jgi:hypothetical protein